MIIIENIYNIYSYHNNKSASSADTGGILLLPLLELAVPLVVVGIIGE